MANDRLAETWFRAISAAKGGINNSTGASATMKRGKSENQGMARDRRKDVIGPPLPRRS
jgi:hypothetical protein